MKQNGRHRAVCWLTNSVEEPRETAACRGVRGEIPEGFQEHWAPGQAVRQYLCCRVSTTISRQARTTLCGDIWGPLWHSSNVRCVAVTGAGKAKGW